MAKTIAKEEIFEKFEHYSKFEEDVEGILSCTTIEYSGTTQYRNNPKRFIARLEKLMGKWVELNKEPEEPIVAGTLSSPEDLREWATGSTFVFTCAQSNTLLNDAFWDSLMHLVTDRDAELHISRITYNKANHGKNSVKPGTKKSTDNDDLWFDPRIEQYLSDESVYITKDLVWNGDLNISPTRVNPLTGFQNHGRGASVIIPHNKMAMKSFPTMKNKDPIYAYSTGTVTQRNYIEKAAGQKASLHHVYGALLVEVDEHGNWWARQLNADGDGTIYDLYHKYTPEGVSQIDRVSTITHGDLHGTKVNTGILESMSAVVDALYPENQVFHDTVDFQPRNHHNIKDPHFLHEQYNSPHGDEVEHEFAYISSLMAGWLARPNTKHWIVTSNHDQAIEGWLRNTSALYDPPNMEFWLRLNLEGAKCRRKGFKHLPFKTTMLEHLPKNYHWYVVEEDESLVICDIEHGMHGHLGPNGARGTPANLRTAGKANTGHTHSAGIIDGVYTAGVFGNLDMGYNKGLSSWSHSFIITYPNGKRTICTFRDGKAWRE